MKRTLSIKFQNLAFGSLLPEQQINEPCS